MPCPVIHLHALRANYLRIDQPRASIARVAENTINTADNASRRCSARWQIMHAWGGDRGESDAIRSLGTWTFIPGLTGGNEREAGSSAAVPSRPSINSVNSVNSSAPCLAMTMRIWRCVMFRITCVTSCLLGESRSRQTQDPDRLRRKVGNNGNHAWISEMADGGRPLGQASVVRLVHYAECSARKRWHRSEPAHRSRYPSSS